MNLRWRLDGLGVLFGTLLCVPGLLVVAAGPGLAQDKPIDARELSWRDSANAMATMPRKALPPAPVDKVRFWIGADYLGWWTKGAAMPPLVTLGNPADPIPGALGQPGTNVLFGGGDVGRNMLSGLRLRAGAALDDNWSVELSGFWLQNRTAAFSTQSDGGGSPLIARPVIVAGTESSYISSFPGFVAGGTAVTFGSAFYGAEANGFRRVQLASGPFGLEAVVGFRYLHLDEELRVSDNLAALVPGFLTFLGGPADPPTSLADFDRFRTVNDFFGPQLGLKGKFATGQWEFGAAGKLALGVTHQTVDISGATTLLTPGAAAISAPGGILAQTTNIGHYSANRFTAVPEIELGAAYRIAPGLQLRVGYNAVYWSDVARAGNQIDRTVNPNVVPSDVLFGTPGGPARPAFSFSHTDFWAQGITVGVQYRY